MVSVPAFCFWLVVEGFGFVLVSCVLLLYSSGWGSLSCWIF